MSTWLDDLKKQNPALAADYRLTGNQSIDTLRKMIRALESLPAYNTPQENDRLAAAKRIVSHSDRASIRQACDRGAQRYA